ncbi:tetratricopeptide repeat protein [Anaerobacillus alkaliphilus]|nr:tetratricopeptide repeat protein [Anaerobacillus alkaliphilus]
MALRLMETVVSDVVDLVNENNYERALPIVMDVLKQLYDKRSYRLLNDLARSVREDQLLPLVCILDAELMPRYSRMLVKMVNKNIDSPFTNVMQSIEEIYQGKYLDAETKIKEVIASQEFELENKVLVRAYWGLAHSLIEMKRFNEAERYLRELEKVSTEPTFDQWGYYYFQKGNWDKAKELYLEGIEKDPKPEYCYILLQSLYLAKGNSNKAMTVIEEGLSKTPHSFRLRLEKVKRLKELEQWDEFLREVEWLEERSPYHGYQSYIQFSKAQIYYQKGDYLSLKSTVSAHPTIFKKTVFENVDENLAEKKVMISTKAVVQKYNYCVPATIAMILDRYGVVKDQEEIAATIYQVNGTRLIDAVEYLHILDMSAQFFFGTVERYKQLTDLGVSILISLDYPNASHVQLLRGYDDHLQAFIIQDPNFPEPMIFAYTDFLDYYGKNDCLSVAIVPNTEAEKISFLPKEEDEIVRSVFNFSDRMEKSDPTAVADFESFAKNNDSVLYTKAYVIKYFSTKGSDVTLLKEVAQQVLEAQPNSDYFKLIIAFAFIRASLYPEATELLKQVKFKKVHQYHFLLGRMAYDQEQYTEACQHFYEALRIEGDHYDTWSYLSICSFYDGEANKGLEYSKISVDINDRDLWNRMNYGFILFRLENWNEARNLYSQILRDYKHHGHAWYERARCDRKLGRNLRALRGLQVAKQLDPTIAYPYAELADLYAYGFNDYERAFQEIKDGLEKTVATDYGLLMTQADLHVDKKQFAEAEQCYELVIKHHRDEPVPILSYAKVLCELHGSEAGTQFLKEEAVRFIDHGPFIIDAGEWLMGRAENAEDEEQAVEWLEAGLGQKTINYDYCWNLYVNLLEKTSYNARARAFLEKQLEQEFPGNANLMCYIGCFYEAAEEIDVANEWYQRALQAEESTFPLYRLGEVQLGQENYEGAKSYYEQCLAVDEGFMVAYHRLAYVERMRERFEEEHHYLFLAFKREHDDVDLDYLLQLSHQVGRLYQVERYMNSIEGQVNEIWRLQILAGIARLKEDFDEEYRVHEYALALEPDNYLVKTALAAFWCRHERYDKAIELSLELLKEEIEDQDVYNILIYAVVTSKRVKQLKGLILNLGLSDPEVSRVFTHFVGTLSQQFSELKEEISGGSNAVMNWVKVKKLQLQFGPVMAELAKLSYELDPNNGIGIEHLGEYYSVHLGQAPEKVKQMALGYLDKGWNIDLAVYYSYLTLTYYPKKDDVRQLKQAAEWLIRCLDGEKYHHIIHNNLGQIYVFLERFEEAGIHFEQSLREDPSYWNPIYGKGRLNVHLKNYELAEKYLKQALELEPNYSGIYAQLTVALAQQGRVDEAREFNEKLLELRPDSIHGNYNKACWLTLEGKLAEAFRCLKYAIENDDEGNYRLEAIADPDLEELRTNPKTARKVRKLLKV